VAAFESVVRTNITAVFFTVQAAASASQRWRFDHPDQTSDVNLPPCWTATGGFPSCN
jgi:hypothetical protein